MVLDFVAAGLSVACWTVVGAKASHASGGKQIVIISNMQNIRMHMK